MTKRNKLAFAAHLANNQTWPERILWSRLRYKQIGYSFMRQAIVCGFIVDFWCSEAKVAIELDGSVHQRPDVAHNDRTKEKAFYREGICCLRFSNSDVYRGMGAVLVRIWENCFARCEKPLRPFVKVNNSSRHEETSEFEALRLIQEDKRLKQHADRFSNRYWKNSRLAVNNPNFQRKSL